MTREEAAEYWDGLRKTFSSQLEKEENHFGRMHLQTTIDVLDTTISALRQQEKAFDCTQYEECEYNGNPVCRLPAKEKCPHGLKRNEDRNDPLTLEELQKMDGEPVWVVWTDGRIKSQWFIISSTFWIEMFQEWDGTLSKDYGKTWLAYRQKPKEGTV